MEGNPESMSRVVPPVFRRRAFPELPLQRD
jgi:hypothetical protein